MLNTTAEFAAAADANTTEADARVRIWREFNAIARDIAVSAEHPAIEERFGPENVVNIRNPKYNGIAYGPLREMFTSSNPKQAYRFILSQDFDADRDVAYYIPIFDSGGEILDMAVDYQQNYKMNCIELRYENSRTSTTYYDNPINIRITSDGGAESDIHTSNMNTDGVTRIYWNGTAWTTSIADLDPDGVDVRSIRLRVLRGTWDHQPRIMYLGGMHVVDVSDDIIDVSVSKTEFDQSTYLPFGEPNGNTCDISLDNTNLNYRFNPDLDNDYFLKKQKMTVEFGLNTKYGGGADSFEYVPAGTFYVDSFGYDEKNLTVNVSGQDFSTILQERMCGNYMWVNKSLKYIVHDVLARSGVSPKNVHFDFGIAKNADERNKRKYTWSTADQTLWDFLSDLAKSELGTVFFDEEENLIFTDRLDIDAKFLDGVQYVIHDDLNLESIEENFEIVANKVKVQYEELNANSTKFNPQLVVDVNNDPYYTNGGETLLNQVLWRPNDDETYLGSATLSHTLKPNDKYMYITASTALQITKDEGEVLIGDEFIQYKNRTEVGKGRVRLEIVKRNARNTLPGGVKTFKGVNSDYNIHTYTYRDTSKVRDRTPTPAKRYNTDDGYRIRLWSGSNTYKHVLHKTRFEKGEQNFNTNYRVYGMRFRFNEMPKKFRRDQTAGIYMNMQNQGYGLFFEISNPRHNSTVVPKPGGNCRAFKTGPNLRDKIPMPPAPDPHTNDYGTDVLYAEATGKNDGTYIDLTVIQVEARGPDIIYWYVNGEYMGQFRTEYSKGSLAKLGYNSRQQTVGNKTCQKGVFGAFISGSTDITIDFMYASNNPEIGPDELTQSRGFHKYYDKGTGSWGVKSQDYKKGREYYIEFGAPVHEVLSLEVDHDTVPNLYARTMSTDDRNVHVINQTHSPFNSKILVANSSRIGVELNSTVFYENGSKADHEFFIYGVGVIRSESDEISTQDGPSIRRYGIEEVEMNNPWVNSKNHAVSLANYIRKYWSQPQQHFSANIFPNPAIQPRDRVQLTYTEKGLLGNDVWFVNGITLRYDGGLSCELKLKRYQDYPSGNFDYRDDGGITIT